MTKIFVYRKIIKTLYTYQKFGDIIKLQTGAPSADQRKGGMVMKISVIGRQMTVSEELKSKVAAKLSKLDKFFTGTADAVVTFSRLRDMECLEIMITYNGMMVRSEEKNTTFLSALDECIDTIERQIRKNKTRLERRMKGGELCFPDADDPADEIEEGEFNIRTKVFPMRPMTPEEAILQMNLLEHTFFVFTDAESGKTCVVYKRKNNDYGMIMPA